MSALSGMGGGSSGAVKPGEAPRIPKRNDADLNNATMKRLQKLTRQNSLTTALLYSSGGAGSAPAPTKSYTSQLFASGGL